jgi:hypothetical protein
MLSAAVVALLSTPAMADKTITGNQTTSESTATDGNLLINAGGGITFKSATVPIVTINSSNTVDNEGTLNGSGQATQTAVLIDTTTSDLTGSFVSNGTIDLSGAGTGKEVLHLTGEHSFIGNISLGAVSTGTTTIVGDLSSGIVTDGTTVLSGNLSLGGPFAISSTTANESTASGIVIASLLGTTEGDVTIASGATYSAVGNGAQGILISGPLEACDTSAVPGCTGTGTFSNLGTLTVGGVSTRSTTVANAEGGSAVVISNSIAGGILNNGLINSADTTNIAAIIAGNGTVPVIAIGPSPTTPVAINIGIDSADSANGIYSFINRGTISASPVDPNQNAHTILIAGSSTLPVTFTVPAGAPATTTGGFFNSGAITAQATSTAPAANSGSANGTSIAVAATALEIDNYVTIPVIYVSAQAATTSGTGGGSIKAAIGGPAGGVATAITIGGTGPTTDGSGNLVTNTNVPEIVIEKGAIVSASATASLTPADNGQTIGTLSAIGIQDVSNSLTRIVNSGTISAVATLTDTTRSVSISPIPAPSSATSCSAPAATPIRSRAVRWAPMRPSPGPSISASAAAASAMTRCMSGNSPMSSARSRRKAR